MADGEHGSEPRAKFHAMTEGTAEDWAVIGQAMAPFVKTLPDRVLAHLKMLDGDCGGFAVDRLEHSLQTATRAFRDGRDEEYVVCALLHDMGDILGPRNHADIAAAVLKPFVSEENHWMVEQHGVFQGYYFFDYLGLDRNMREQFRGHPAFERTAQFCHLYDQSAFDPAYESMPLEAFEPMVRRVFSTVKRSIYVNNPQAA
ncbi:phosphohydrolase [Caulobacter sp. CCUG 60055]|uniref:HD domain-containing protein n=1 Tax=Caulobacter sp. CCUG 60055 TaxID=2100090 RepID=UPI001FA73FD0|nr:HD domain-containing protein [Caulobacter sp. CCUG 60055]MCI3181806.1 phosphohydrolase [Caulobacter sp. CCUG 60055]